MAALNDCLNKVGVFRFVQTEDIYYGVLYIDEKGCVILSVLLSRLVFSTVQDNINIVGKIVNNKVTMVNPHCYLSSSYYGSDLVNAFYSPSEIVIGEEYDDEIHIKEIETSISQLEKFVHLDYKLQNRNLDERYPIEILSRTCLSALDADGELKIGGASSLEVYMGTPRINRDDYILYRYKGIATLQDGISKLASCRNLLAFFADYYLEMSDCFIVDMNNNYCNVIFNYQEGVKKLTEPFIITWNQINSSFDDVWKRWCRFREEDPCIVELFYEIISDNSTRINMYLNLCQAIEVFSSRYRDSEARIVSKTYVTKGGKAPKKVLFEHRVYEILNYVGLFEHEEGETIKKCASKIKDARNYFTHYGKNKVKPDYSTIIIYGRFLRAILLMVIYKEVGVLQDNEIKLYKYQYIINRVIEDSR